MNYNTPAKLGVKLSSLGIGCMRFPLIKGESDPKKVDKENAGKMIRRKETGKLRLTARCSAPLFISY